MLTKVPLMSFSALIAFRIMRANDLTLQIPELTLPYGATKFAGIIAGGVGSRIAALTGGRSKAMLDVRGRPLVDYVITDLADAGIEHLCVVLRPEDEELVDFLERETRFSSVEAIPCVPTGGTLSSVLALTEHFGDENHLISTCDVVVARGTVGRLLRAAETDSVKGMLAVVLTCDHVEDENPVWVDVDEHSVVADFGKEIAPAAHAYGHIRWVSRNFLGALSEVDLSNTTRDTEMMRRVVTAHPGRVRAMDAGYVLDVDDEQDLLKAQRFLDDLPSA